jgi:hypothetical protein
MVPFLMHILLIRGTQAEVTEDLPISTEVLFQFLLRRHAPGTWVIARWSQRQTPSDSDSKQEGCKGRQGKLQEQFVETRNQNHTHLEASFVAL